MKKTLPPLLRRISVLLLAILFALPLVAPTTLAQEKTDADNELTGNPPPEYETVVSAVHAIVGILQNVTRRHAADPINDQLQNITTRLSDAADVSYGGFRGPDPLDDDLLRLLKNVERDLQSLARSLEHRDEDDLARRLNRVVDELGRAIAQVEDDEAVIARSKTGKWYDTGWYGGDDRRRRGRNEDWDDDDWIDDDWDDGDREDREGDDDDWDDDDYEWVYDFGDEWDDFFDRNWNWHCCYGPGPWVGGFGSRWPYTERGLYNSIPSVRYNRVEGLVFGVGMDPLNWSDFDRGRLYGQVGYALGLDDWRYEIGAESRLTDVRHRSAVDLKVGGAYHRNTSTRDLWKSSWLENTLAAGLFRHDFFDYYETEGWTLYLVGRASQYLQFSAGYREDTYSSLSRNVTWSLFGGDSFRENPAIRDGELHSFVFAAEGGEVRGLNRRPRGAAFRLEAEIGQGLGGDFDFSRYLGDVRTYARLSRHSGLNLRFRGGFTEGDVPVQKAFTLGGVGSVRSYPQNVFLGTRMLLANAELELYEPEIIEWLFDDVTVFGLFDAGWTNSSGRNEFDLDDVIPAAGLGLALDDRHMRFELAWPLRDLGTGREPTLWLRLTPTF